MNLTPSQRKAVSARGNVLVVAGAGTGKTSTLVERCLNCLLEEQTPASLDEILMVTFAEAAAAEMRQRIRTRLEEQQKTDPENPRWHEQLALFETTHIGTLHSFCLQLVRQHFYELELDPQLTVLAEEEARLLADETLEQVMQGHYEDRSKSAEPVQELIQAQGRGWDRPIRTLVLRLHHYTQTLPDPARWFREQLEMFAQPKPFIWEKWLLLGISAWAERSKGMLSRLDDTNMLAEKCVGAVRALAEALSGVVEQPSAGQLSSPKTEELRSAAATCLEKLSAVRDECPDGKKIEYLDPLKSFLNEAEFLCSLSRLNKNEDPLAQDWDWVRGQMTTLLELAQEFEQAFTQNKRELGMVDFQDLEQHTLRLLWNNDTHQPTTTAQQWRRKLRFVFVDEYQDINAAQDKIIVALSREDAKANRFLVGDVKQSIYRFRLANPYIFQDYIERWGQGADTGTAIPLVENFRSRESILDFINSFFSLLMQGGNGGVDYDAEDQLRFGAPAERQALTRATTAGLRVELHLRLKGTEESPVEEENAEALSTIADLEDADKEARLVAMRLQQLVAEKYPIWDEQTKSIRPVQWGDMAILLRAPSRKSESYAKEFSRLNLPLRVERGGFYESLEVMDLLSLLQILDNPLQDLPLLAVLRSPLVGLTLTELATIRLIMEGPFWTALHHWHEKTSRKSTTQDAQSHFDHSHRIVQDLESRSKNHKAKTEASPPLALSKVTTFLERYGRWRRLARQVSLSRCLDAVLSETHYDAWLLTQPRGEQRHANIERLLGLAQQFDHFQRQGLFRFLCFVDAQQMAEAEPEVAATVTEEDAIRLMSIHQSKGLEFPVVIVADLAKPFNVSDLRADLILDEDYGLCPQVKPPKTGIRYPSLPYWLARQRQTRELISEELRLLYVAMTRARDTLILSGHVSNSRFEKLWKNQDEPNPDAAFAARNYADWLGTWFARHVPLPDDGAKQGKTDLLNWFLHDDADLLGNGADATPSLEADHALISANPKTWQRLNERLAWKYAFEPATRQPAKASVSALRRRATELNDDASTNLFWVGRRFSRKPGPAHKAAVGPPVAAEDIGNAHHTFLQLVSLDHVDNAKALGAEAERLVKTGGITSEERALLDFETIAGFWNSQLGQRIRRQAKFIKRELPFTARFSAQELAEFTGEPAEPALQDEFIVVQGVADLAVLLPDEIWLVDFKTDKLRPADIAARAQIYEPQLKLYARALSRIFNRPVSHCCLYFLSCNQAVEVNTPSELAPRAHRSATAAGKIGA